MVQWGRVCGEIVHFVVVFTQSTNFPSRVYTPYSLGTPQPSPQLTMPTCTSPSAVLVNSGPPLSPRQASRTCAPAAFGSPAQIIASVIRLLLRETALCTFFTALCSCLYDSWTS